MIKVRRSPLMTLFKEGSLNIEDNAAITNFSLNYAVESELVKKAIKHLLDINLSDEKLSVQIKES